jgi:hypothetical protein
LALPGILTGVVLGIARVAGESAPLLFTALFSNYWPRNLREPTASLSILIYNFSSMPFDNQIKLAWAASLILVLIVLDFNILSRVVGRSRIRKAGRLNYPRYPTQHHPSDNTGLDVARNRNRVQGQQNLLRRFPLGT